jgi:hypothetical protein
MLITPVAPGDVGDDDVEPGAVAQGRVDERGYKAN